MRGRNECNQYACVARWGVGLDWSSAMARTRRHGEEIVNGAKRSTSASGHEIGRMETPSRHVHVMAAYPTHAPSSVTRDW